jgi:hypothetical protein
MSPASACRGFGSLVLLFAVHGPCPGEGSPPFPVRLTAFDQVAAPGEIVPLTAKLESACLPGWHPGLDRAVLEFSGVDADLRVAPTAADGRACVTAAVPLPCPAPVPVTVRYAGSRWHGAGCAAARLFVWPADCPILVTDIDRTISDLSLVLVPFKPVEKIPPLPGCVEVLHELARSYRIVYLTARPSHLYDKTRAWLAAHGFPDGPVFCREIRLGQSQEAYKREFLAALKCRFPNLVVGVGDRWGDARAYRSAGLRAYLIDRSGRACSEPGAVVVGSWLELAELLRQQPVSPVSPDPPSLD